MHLSDRHKREIEYHRRRAAEYLGLASQPLDRFASRSHRWWNAYSVILRKAIKLDLSNKRLLVIGSGFGNDAILLNLYGAKEIYAIDISEDSTTIACQRAIKSKALIHFCVSPAEDLPFQDKTFDLVYIPDVMHHLDITRAIRDIRRVLKTDGWILGNEPYTHSWIQAIRDSRLVRDVLYQKMVKYIYNHDTPYITVDERKLNQKDLQMIRDEFGNITKEYFLLTTGRIFPINKQSTALLDRIILLVPCIGYFLAGRIVFTVRSRPWAPRRESRECAVAEDSLSRVQTEGPKKHYRIGGQSATGLDGPAASLLHGAVAPQRDH